VGASDNLVKSLEAEVTELKATLHSHVGALCAQVRQLTAFIEKVDDRAQRRIVEHEAVTAATLAWLTAQQPDAPSAIVRQMELDRDRVESPAQRAILDAAITVIRNVTEQAEVSIRAAPKVTH